MLTNKKIGILLLISHVLSSFTIGFLSRFYNKSTFDIDRNYITDSKNNSSKNISELLKESIQNSITNVLTIGGFVLLAAVVISILESINFITLTSDFLSNIFNLSSNIFSNFLYGIIEVTNGVNGIANLSINLLSKIIIISFLLGFGGFTVCMQVLGFTSKTDISIKPYLIGKFFQGIISSFYTYLLFKYIPYFYNGVSVFSGTIYDVIIENNDIETGIFSSQFHWYILVGVLICLGIFLLKSNNRNCFRSNTNTCSKILKKNSTTSNQNNNIKIRIR